MAKINNVHDKYFRAMMSEPELVVDLLKLVLPPQVLALIDLMTLKPQKGSFIDKNLESTFSDAIFTVSLVNEDREAYISILLEHKSNPDKYTAFQVLGYKHNGYQNQIKKNETMRVILPIVYYHGKVAWDIKYIKDFFLDSPPDLMRYIPNFDMVFVDLNQMRDEDLMGLRNSLLLVAVSVQKYSHHPEKLLAEIERIITTIAQCTSGNFFNQTIVYYFQLIDQEPDQVLQIVQGIETTIKQKVMSTYQKILEQGQEKGMIEVIRNGIKNGLSIDTLVTITGLSKERVVEIVNKAKLEGI